MTIGWPKKESMNPARRSSLFEIASKVRASNDNRQSKISDRRKEVGMAEIQRHDNRLGLWGWLGGGRWGVERYAYILHRLTGLGILCYFLMHVVVTSLRAKGIYLWVEGGVLPPAHFQVRRVSGFRGFRLPRL